MSETANLPILSVHFDPDQKYALNVLAELINRQACLQRICGPVLIEVSGLDLPDQMASDVQHHFYHLAVSTEEELILSRRRAKRTTLRGLLFLLSCFCVAYLAGMWGTPVGKFIEVGVTIPGWVVMWRPMELLLYGLGEQRKRLRRYKWLAQSEVIAKEHDFTKEATGLVFAE
jgi:hypothetical protein